MGQGDQAGLCLQLGRHCNDFAPVIPHIPHPADKHFIQSNHSGDFLYHMQQIYAPMFHAPDIYAACKGLQLLSCRTGSPVDGATAAAGRALAGHCSVHE